MNILFHCSEYPVLSKSGGIGTATKIVAEELIIRGHSVYVAGYYPGQKERVRKEDINGVKIFMFNRGLRRGVVKSQITRFLNAIHLAGPIVKHELRWYEIQLQKLIDENKIDILELTDFYGINSYRAKLKHRRFNIPTVLRVHGSMSFINSHLGKYNSFAKENEKSHFSRADYLCSVSYFSQKYIDDTYKLDHFHKKKVVFNPIESCFLKENSPSENKTILFIGKILKTKGAFSILLAFNKVIEKFPDWNLRLLGRGNIEEAKSLVSNNAINNVEFMGFCDRDTIMKEIDKCTFACIPSFFENFSMVPLEVMGRSRAMIFTNRTSGSEVIQDGEDGFTVNPENIDEIYEKITKLILDKELRDLFALRGYNKVKNQFVVEHIVDELERFYSDCINDWFLHK